MVKLKTPDRNFDAETALYEFVKQENGDKILQCYHHQLEYLVLESFGEDLRSFYQADIAVRTGPLLNEILSAVHSLHHGLGYVHGDLQPGSIRISESHGQFSCKLCHFDNACRVGAEFPRLEGSLRITETWTCPELFWAHHNKVSSITGSFQMDVFNLGLIIDLLCQPAEDLTPNKSVIDVNSSTRQRLFLPENQDQFFQTIHCLRNEHWFGDLLRTMLSFDPQRRSDIQIYRESFREKTLTNLFLELRQNQEELGGELEEDYVLDSGLDPYVLYLTETVGPSLTVLFDEVINQYMSWDQSGQWLKYFMNLFTRLSSHQSLVLYAALNTIHWAVARTKDSKSVNLFVQMITEFDHESWQNDEVALANVVMTARRHDEVYLQEQSRFYHPQGLSLPAHPQLSHTHRHSPLSPSPLS
jgi:serine/threonine protein kinase